MKVFTGEKEEEQLGGFKKKKKNGTLVSGEGAEKGGDRTPRALYEKEVSRETSRSRSAPLRLECDRVASPRRSRTAKDGFLVSALYRGASYTDRNRLRTGEQGVDAEGALSRIGGV